MASNTNPADNYTADTQENQNYHDHIYDDLQAEKRYHDYHNYYDCDYEYYDDDDDYSDNEYNSDTDKTVRQLDYDRKLKFKHSDSRKYSWDNVRNVSTSDKVFKEIISLEDMKKGHDFMMAKIRKIAKVNNITEPSVINIDMLSRLGEYALLMYRQQNKQFYTHTKKRNVGVGSKTYRSFLGTCV